MTSTTEQHRDTARRFLEQVWSEGDLETAEEILTPDVAFVLSFMKTEGVAAFMDLVRRNRTAFKDLTYRVDELVADDTQAAAYWTMSAEHVDTWNKIEATGKAVSIEGMSFFKFDGDRIREVRVQNDVMGLMRQLQSNGG